MIHIQPATEEEWHKLRQNHIGGSEIAALFDVQPDYALSRFALWHVKAGNTPPPPVGGDRVKWGNRLEPYIAAGAAEDEGWTISKGGYVIDAQQPHMGCTLDFIIEQAPDRNTRGALECKNADWLQHKRVWEGEEPPVHIGLQLQQQLGCTGFQWGVVACLVGGNDLKLYRYEAKPKIIAEIRRRIAAFYASIEAGEEPKPDGSSTSAAVLRALYESPADDVADMIDNAEMSAECARFLRAKEIEKEAEKTKKEAENRIKALLANHQKARANGFFVNLSIGKDTPSRIAAPGEIIKGRNGPRTLHVKESIAAE